MVLNCSPSVRRWRLWPGTLGPCKAWPSGHRLRRQGLDKGQRLGTRSTVRSTARRGWIAHFHPLVFQKRHFSGGSFALRIAGRGCHFDYSSPLHRTLHSARGKAIGGGFRRAVATVSKTSTQMALMFAGSPFAPADQPKARVV